MQHKYDIDAVDQYLRDLLKVSNHLHLIALELTYYLEWPSIWWNYSGIWRGFLSDFGYGAQRNTSTSGSKHLFAEETYGNISSSCISDRICAWVTLKLTINMLSGWDLVFVLKSDVPWTSHAPATRSVDESDQMTWRRHQGYDYMISLFVKYRIPWSSILGESIPLMTDCRNTHTSSQFDNFLYW